MNKLIGYATGLAILILIGLWLYMGNLTKSNDINNRNEAIRQEVAKHQEDDKKVKDRIRDRYTNQVKWDKEITNKVNNELEKHKNEDSHTYTITSSDSNNSL